MSWKDDITYAMTPSKFLTWPLGVWPLQKYNIFALIRTVVCVVSLIVMMILLFLEINFGNGSIYEKLDSLMLMFCNILSILKLLSFRIYADNLIRNFFSAVNDYIAIDTENKRTIMRRHAFMGRMICYSISFFGYMAPILFLIPVIVSSMLGNDEDIQVNISVKNLAMELPVPLPWTLGNYHLSTNVYYVIFIVQYILLTLNCSGNVGNDILLLGIILHICGQMELLKIEFINYNGKNKDIKEFEALTSRHCYLMEHAELLIDVISFVLLVQLLFSCFQLILALKLHDAVIITKTTSVLSALLLQLFSYSFVGDYLKRQMEDIAHSIYSCNWYYFPLKLMRNVLFVIMRSQQPVQLLAGRFVVVTIETYMSILKNSFSYLSVLRTGMMIMLFLEIIFGSSDAYVKLDALMLMFCNVLSVLKLLSFRIYANNMIRNFTSAINDYLAINSKKKQAIMRQHAFMGRIISCSILFFAYLASTIFCLVPIIVSDEENIQVNVSIKNQASDLPIPLTWSLGSYHLSANLFFVISIVQYFLLVLNSNCNCGSDSLFLAITTHVCGQMEILKIEFVNYGVKSKNIFEDFSKLASRHHYLMEHAELLVEVISFVLLVQMLFSCLIICLIASSIFTLAPMITDDENVHVNITIKNQAAKLPVPITFLGNLQIPTGLYFVISTVQYFILLLTGTSNCGFQFILALKSHDVVMITKTISVLSGLLLQLFFYSFVGDYMKCQMEQIAHSIYSSNWYYLPTKLMRNVLLVIMRSQQPVQLLAASSIFTLAPMMTGDEDIHINVSIKNEAAKLPVPITFLGNLQIPTDLYFIISMVQYFILLLTGTSNCGNDSLFLAITLHVCGQLELLKIEFSNYGVKSKNINECFQFILALKSHDAVMITKTITVLSTLLLQLFFYSFVGDYMKCQMEQVAHSIYISTWYYLPTKLMRNVLANDAPMIDSHYGQRLTLLRIVQRVVLLVIAIMSWNDDMAYAMTLYKFLTLPLGVWPLQKYNTFSLIRSIVCGFSLSVMLITMLLEINFGNGDAYVKIDTLMVMSCIILATLKLLSFRLYADNLICNYSSAVDDYSTIDTEEKRTIMRRHAFMGRIICYMTCAYCVICFSGFQFILALKSHDILMLTKTTTVMSALLLQMFFYSFVGDYLKCQMEEIADSIYNSNWYYLPTRLMRNVLFVIVRSQQPIQFLAGRFFVVNIKTYMVILKSSLSYLSVLRVMVESST
ncbi:Odorant receptor 2a [Atta colombica]|uniref:Odorant receptor 2a n=1 Tax=Atta colombica TaxID=520822 RepID=A0A195BSA6_9HYME|nr:Odorant receptor 2a [Atta colombica]